MPYRIYTQTNLADTSRDPDEYIYKHIAYTKSLSDAVEIANDHIKQHFFTKDSKLRKGEGVVALTAIDFCSYGARIIIEEVQFSKLIMPIDF